MNIYVGHSTQYDYKNELYRPIRENIIGHTILLPHEYSEEPFNSKVYIPIAELMIAEVSFPSTGLGIELGWADFSNVPIVLLHKAEAKVSKSLSVITKEIYAYDSEMSLIYLLKSILNRRNNK